MQVLFFQLRMVVILRNQGIVVQIKTKVKNKVAEVFANPVRLIGGVTVAQVVFEFDLIAMFFQIRRQR